MKRSGDPVIGRSGDRIGEFTAETRRHGEGSGDRVIGKAAYLCHPERVGAYATASRRIPTKPVPEYAASGSSHETLRDFLPRLASAIRTLRATLREIFDESAYDRFLLRTNAARSIGSYRAFTRERDVSVQKKPRCC